MENRDIDLRGKRHSNEDYAPRRANLSQKNICGTACGRLQSDHPFSRSQVPIHAHHARKLATAQRDGNEIARRNVYVRRNTIIISARQRQR